MSHIPMAPETEAERPGCTCKQDGGNFVAVAVSFFFFSRLNLYFIANKHGPDTN